MNFLKIRYLNKHFFFVVLLALSSLVFSSCENAIDGKKTLNPNTLTEDKAQIDFLINGVQENFAGLVQEMGDIGARHLRQKLYFGENYSKGFAPGSLSGYWNVAYRNIMKNNEVMLEMAKASNLDYYLGMGKVIKAYSLITLVDYFGDVPSEESLKGSVSFNPNPTAGSAVYAQALTLLEEAKAHFSSTNSAQKPQYDMFYNGNASKWIKAVNSIKIQMYYTTQLVDASSVQAIKDIISSGEYIAENSDDFQFQWGDQQVNPDTRHPEYRYNYTSTGGGDYQSNYLMNLMLNGFWGGKDPRMDFYFYRQNRFTPGSDGAEADEVALECSVQNQKPAHYSDSDPYCTLSGGFWGRDHMNDEGIPPDGFKRTLAGIFPAGGSYDDDSFKAQSAGDGLGGKGITQIITASLIDLFLAEIYLRESKQSEAVSYFESGIKKHFSKVKTYLPSSITMTQNEEQAYERYQGRLKNNFNYYINIQGTNDWMGELADPMNFLAEQLLIASYGNGSHIYNFYRRTGYPNDLQPALLDYSEAGAFPRSLWYPAISVINNSNMNQKPNVQVQVFWDTNAASPNFPPAN